MPGEWKDSPCSDPTCPICIPLLAATKKKYENPTAAYIQALQGLVEQLEKNGQQMKESTDKLLSQAAIAEPPPQTNNYPHVADVVAADMLSRDLPVGMAKDVMERKAAGMKKYGTALQPCNGRNNLNDLYQELIDAVKYAKTELLQELIGEKPPKTNKISNVRELEMLYDDLLAATEKVYNLLHDGDTNGA